MPYTPPSHRSPSSSAPASPETSRRSSFLVSTGNRPSLPRSASYLTRHRRTASATVPGHGNAHQPTPEATSEDLKGMVSGSVRQSPPPVTDDKSIPKGAIVSPPDSNTSSDDDDLPEVRGRTIENLRELQDAISQIPQHRTISPDKSADARVGAGDLLVTQAQEDALAEGMVHSFSTGALDELAHGGRRMSHARSITEPSILVTKSADQSLTASEEESEDEEVLRKPPMVRKKSGELVRPALRLSSRRRPSSMPGTPTFSKAVHFDSHLEHVRHFLQVDRPLAVSAGSSPADNYDSDSEYPFAGDERAGSNSPSFEWEIIIANFPVDTPLRAAQPVRLERVWLSADQKCLIGSVVVANLAFQKTVTCRFTLDYWKTTSEVGAEYVSEIRSKEAGETRDRFQFSIKLSDMANLESKTLYFCVRYSVNGQEHWDNNGGTNFQVDFRKKVLPQKGKQVAAGAISRPAGSLPRSNRRAQISTAPRPKSMPVGFDEFGDHPRVTFDQSIHDYLGESAPTSLRLKGVKSSTSIASDNLSSRLSAPSGQAFGNRYDFAASLSAAMQAAKDSNTRPSHSDGLYMKVARRPTPPPVATRTAQSPPKSPPKMHVETKSVVDARPTVADGGLAGSAGITSSSYEELVNKYCFFGSKQSSPQLKDGTFRGGSFDGSGDAAGRHGSNSSSSSSSSNGSPVLQGPRHIQGAQHHSLNMRDSNPYFQNASHFGIVATLPADSPVVQSPIQGGMASSSLPRSVAAVAEHALGRSTSPASPMGSIQPLTGTSPIDFDHQHLSDRFPFSGAETHTSTAIRG